MIFNYWIQKAKKKCCQNSFHNNLFRQDCRRLITPDNTQTVLPVHPVLLSGGNYYSPFFLFLFRFLFLLLIFIFQIGGQQIQGLLPAARGQLQQIIGQHKADTEGEK